VKAVAQSVRNTFFSFDARTLSPIGDALEESSASGIAAAVQRAVECFPIFASVPDRSRSALLHSLAEGLERHREHLIDLADRETALGRARLSGELDRTAFQLRAFADYIADGSHRQTQVEDAIDAPPPRGRPRLIRTRVPIGPVAVFAASNFPFAFSVLGGDTAAALAAGTPVVVKAHPAHAHLSLELARLAREVIQAAGWPDDVLQLVQGPSAAVGVALATAPGIQAVAFTGSVRAGRALQQAVNSRTQPIPFYGELGSTNPVIGFPQALAAGGRELAQKLAASMTLGAGQFCTSPGVLLVLDRPESKTFMGLLADCLRQAQTHPMLTRGIRESYERQVQQAACIDGATVIAGGPSEQVGPTPTLIEVSATNFLANGSLHDEVFGPFCLVVTARDADEMRAVLAAVAGSLTATVWAAESEAAVARPVVAQAARIAGRVLFAGVPTGVAVTAAQQHGGPWPSSTRPDTTSVGLAAIDRFLRPIALQDVARDLLPPGIQI
jgi:acyl-CoA reductase-like NAD-dependent aldehyde dehydrogenase